MSFDWREYLDLAKHLHQSAGGNLKDSMLRSAISRAYYAALNESKDFLKKKNVISPHIMKNGLSHENIISTFRSGRDRGYSRIGANLDRLRDLRVKADYKESALGANNIQSETDFTIRRASSLLNFIDTL